MKHLFSLAYRWLLSCLLVSLSFSQAAQASDIDVLRTRLLADFDTLAVASNSTVASWLSTQNADGSWPGIDYTDTSSGVWSPSIVHSRLLSLAIVYTRAGNTYYHSLEVLNSLRTGLSFYVYFQPKIHSVNFWHNEIGEGLSFGPLLLLTQAYLPATLVTATAARLKNTLPSGCGGTCTGANLIWVATNVIYRGCIENNADYVTNGMATIESTLVITTEEGVQPDYSFHQHGAQLYNGGYGRDYLQYGTYWAYLARGLAYAFTPAHLAVLTNLTLDGDAWMVRGQHADYSVMGREITRPESSAEVVAVLTGIIPKLVAVGSARVPELKALAVYLTGGATPVPNGDRHYWFSDYHSHRRAGYFSSVRMHSTRTLGMETINGEGLRDYFLSYGANLLYLSGNEYNEIFPVWDWARIPGVTGEHLDSIPTYDRQFGLASFVGGVSDSTTGAVALDLHLRGSTLTGHKAWFFFDEAYVCLGTGLTATSSYPIYTSVNQCLRNGTVTAKLGTAAPDTLAPTTQAAGISLAAPQWVHHDGVGYVFPGAPGNVQFKNQSQSGSWQDISSESSPTVLSKNVFSLWLDHGLNPTGATYQYVVVPNVTPAQLTTYAATLPLRVLTNTLQVQAVRHDAAAITQAAFYQAGSITMQAGRVLTVDQPCLVLLHETDPSSATLAVSNPLNAALTVMVSLTGHWTGTGATYVTASNTTQIQFELLGGNAAGQSVVRKITSAMALASRTSTLMPGAFYPNPVADVLTVAGAPQGTPICINDLLGRVVLRTTLGAAATVDVRTLAPGSYFLTVGLGPERRVGQFTKSAF